MPRKPPFRFRRVESSFFAGRFEDDFNVAVFTTTATQWKMKEADEDVVIITALADIDNLVCLCFGSLQCFPALSARIQMPRA